MKCPRCETTALDERERDGITVDVCAGCRGLWLDRGELEKLIARATRELEELSVQPAPQQAAAVQSRPVSNAPAPVPEPRRAEPEYYRERRDSTPPHGVRYDRDRDAYDRDRRHHHGHHRKRSFLDILGDVFD
jgi:Zn-finger nucleic acid-binding protein